LIPPDGFTSIAGTLSRDEAAHALADKPNGSFLVRESLNDPGTLVVSVASGNVSSTVLKCRVRRTNNGKVRRAHCFVKLSL
jgi:hypothetical protein